MMRLHTYSGLSFVATLAIIYHAFKSRGQFYLAMVYLSTFKISSARLLNMGLVIMCVIWQITKKVFLGSLREAEVERLNEQSWREFMEILFAITIFGQDFSVKFLAMVTALLLIKALHQLAQKRLEYIETTPAVSTLSHIRIVSFMGFLLLMDSLFLYSSMKYLLETRQASVSLFFAFDYALIGLTYEGHIESIYNWYMIMATTTFSLFVKYIFYVSDMLMEGQWERKAVYTFYLELVRDLLHLSMYLCFFLVIFVNYGVPLHLIRELYETFRNFKLRVADYIHYRKITSNMNDRFPDATPEELNASDATCIIGREEMITAKKLVCGHLFHVHCLRSWLERQHTCPTCRALVIPVENESGTSGKFAIGLHMLWKTWICIGTSAAGSSLQGSTSDTLRNDNVRRHQARLQVAASAAAIYERSYIYPSASTLAWSPGYALLPQAYKIAADSSSTSSINEQASLGQQQFAILGGHANLPFPQFPQCVFLPNQVPGANMSHGERQYSSPYVQESGPVQRQIEILQNLLEKLNAEKKAEVEMSPRESSDRKGKEVASSISSISESVYHED